MSDSNLEWLDEKVDTPASNVQAPDLKLAGTYADAEYWNSRYEKYELLTVDDRRAVTEFMH